MIILLGAGVIIWDNFFRAQPSEITSECMAVCLAADSYVSGWYNSCTGELIRYSECSDKTPLALSDSLLGFQGDDVSGSPATEYCQSQGGTVTERSVADESYTICSFSDGSECEAWTFFRGDCAPGEYQEFAQAKILYEDQVLGFTMRIPVLWLEKSPEYSLIPVGDVSYQSVIFFKDKQPLFSICRSDAPDNVPGGFKLLSSTAENRFFLQYLSSSDEDKVSIIEVTDTFTAK